MNFQKETIKKTSYKDPVKKQSTKRQKIQPNRREIKKPRGSLKNPQRGS